MLVLTERIACGTFDGGDLIETIGLERSFKFIGVHAGSLGKVGLISGRDY
jgi:hypothetical protein